MSQQFRITLDQQDHFFKILEPVSINRETVLITLEVDKKDIVQLKKTKEGGWINQTDDFNNMDLIERIVKAISLRFRI